MSNRENGIADRSPGQALTRPPSQRSATRSSGQVVTQSPRQWLAASLGVGLVAVLLIALAYTAIWPLTVDIGERDARFAQGFHEPERFGDTLFRWTTGSSELALPRPPGGPSILNLRLLNGYPEGQPDPRLTLSNPCGHRSLRGQRSRPAVRY